MEPRWNNFEEMNAQLGTLLAIRLWIILLLYGSEEDECLFLELYKAPVLDLQDFSDHNPSCLLLTKDFSIR